MRSSIRTITNVSLDNRTVDLTEEGLSYQINSDHISLIVSEYTDIDSRSSFLRTLGDGIDTDYSRGQKISVSMSSGFTAGHDYMCVQTIYQRKAGDMSEEDTTGNFDVYMGAGRVQQDSEVTTYVFIDKDIGFYRSPVRRNDKLVGGCILRLNDRDLLITAYNPTTGRATVEGVDSSTTRTTAQGENYKLITNYLVCDAFVFFYRTTPNISVSCTLTTNGIEAVGTYSQAQGTEIQSWRMWADYNNNGDGQHSQLQSKMKIFHETHFNTDMEDIFPLSATPDFGDNADFPAAVDIYLEVTTQDGVTSQTRERLGYSADYPLTVTLGITPDSPQISGMSSGRHFVYRNQEMAQGSSSALSGYKYLGSQSTPNTFRTSENGYMTSYQYIVCGVDENGNIYYGESDVFENDIRQWSLEHIIKTGYNEYRTDGDRVYFTVDLQPSQIETVVGGTVYGTEGRFPKFMHGSDRYDTGSFTALLGSINYPEAAVYNIDKWAKFISQDGLFLLKTDQGDVKVIAITGNPTRQYGSSLAEIGLTRVTYTYAEVADINEVVVR